MTQVTLPYTLSNGQPNDADQLMADLNAILSAVNGGLDVSNLSSSLQQLLWATGDLKTTVASSPPAGWLICDGTPVSRSTYGALWNVIRGGHAGTSGDPAPYGNGDGTTTFNLPDLKGRVLVGKGDHATVDSLGDSDGLASGVRSPHHWHPGIGQSAQTHPNEVGNNSDRFQIGWGGTDRSIDGTRVGDQSGPQDGPAFLTVNVMIKT